MAKAGRSGKAEAHTSAYKMNGRAPSGRGGNGGGDVNVFTKKNCEIVLHIETHIECPFCFSVLY